MRTLLAILLIVALVPAAAFAQGRGRCSSGGRPVQLAPGRGWGYAAQPSYSRPCNSRPVYNNYARPLYNYNYNYARPAYYNTGFFYGNTPYFTPYGFYGAGYNRYGGAGSSQGYSQSNDGPARQEVEVEEVEPAEGDDKPTIKLPDIQ